MPTRRAEVYSSVASLWSRFVYKRQCCSYNLTHSIQLLSNYVREYIAGLNRLILERKKNSNFHTIKTALYLRRKNIVFDELEY